MNADAVPTTANPPKWEDLESKSVQRLSSAFDSYDEANARDSWVR